MANTMQFDKNEKTFPKRSELPEIPGAPKGAAWFWGKDDQLGRLNLLTKERVMEAAKEIQTGEVVSLNLPLEHPSPPCFGRETFGHTINPLSKFGYDDVISFNTQSGSQWDGLRHFAHMPSGCFYNNATFDSILNTKNLGINAISNHGIVARGVLLDFGSYAEANGLKTNFYDNEKISLDTLKAVGKAQGINILPEAQGGEIRPGDILLIRSGWVKNYWGLNSEEKAKAHLGKHVLGPTDGQRYFGIEQSEEMLDWLFDCWWAAVGGDSPAFEAWPSEKDYYLHEHLIALWGCPIGELWDLEKLAEKCKENGRYTFMLTSSPLNVEGGVGSPPNVLAIF